MCCGECTVKRGRFIVLEGIDGAGTTTMAEVLRKWLEDRGIKAVITREPTDGPIGALIRNALKGRIRASGLAGGGEVPKETIALLFAADRVDHIASEILPALRKGVWVISDRYVDSSVAYQGTLIDSAWVREINRYATSPDLTVFLDVDVKAALSRITRSRVGKDLFEKKALLDRVAAAYREHYSSPSRAVAVIDANRSITQVAKALTALVAQRFQMHSPSSGHLARNSTIRS
jgi:dTMP kinase